MKFDRKVSLHSKDYCEHGKKFVTDLGKDLKEQRRVNGEMVIRAMNDRARERIKNNELDIL